MVLRIFIIFISLAFSSCSWFVGPMFPKAYLVVDGKSYEMTSGSSCWGKMCSDSFSYITNKIPVPIGSKSKISILLESNSALEEVYIENFNTKYFDIKESASESADPVDIEFVRKFNESNSNWEPKPENEQQVSEISSLKLLSKKSQDIQNTYFDGQYILSLGTWWAAGDASFKILVKGIP